MNQFRQIICVLILSLSSFNAIAKPSSNDVQSETLVELNLGIYSTLARLRDSHERSFIKGQTLEIWYRKDLRKLSVAERSKFLCSSVKWLIIGRRAASKGLNQLFKSAPQLETVKMVTYDLDTSVALDKAGKYDQRRKVKPLLIISMTKEKLSQIDASKVKLSLERDRCDSSAKRIVSKFWTSIR